MAHGLFVCGVVVVDVWTNVWFLAAVLQTRGDGVDGNCLDLLGHGQVWGAEELCVGVSISLLL